MARHDSRVGETDAVEFRCGLPARPVKRSRQAFTLVELLAVIAIIGVLVGLLLPAVQVARESARRSTCANNIKQIVLAAANYENAMKVLPPGSYVAFGITWWHATLPYLEHAEVFAKYNPRYAYQGGPTTPRTNEDVIKSPVANQRCPSDTGPLTSPNIYAGQRYNYVANFGNLPLNYDNSSGILSRLSSDVNGAMTLTNGGAPFLCEGTNWTSNHSGNVLFFPGSSAAPAGVTPMPTRVALRRVTDGLSKTMAFSELRRGTTSGTTDDMRGLPWHAQQTFFMAWLPPNSNTRDRLAGSCVHTATAPCELSNFSPFRTHQAARSAHSGGVTVAMLDGAVTFVTDGVDYTVWQAASTTAGAETVSLDQ